MRSSLVKILGAVCVLSMLSGCGDKDDNKKDGQPPAQEQSKKGDDKNAPPPKPPEVGVVTLKTENVELNVELPGRVSAFQSAEIRPQVNGIVQQRLFEEGSLVVAGQQLYQIDPAVYQANLNTAAAQLKRAEAQAKSAKSLAGRYRDLVKINAVSKQENDDAVAAQAQAEADVAIAQAARDTAQINLDYTKVFSPISGRIGKSSVTPGALVTANQEQPLALVQQVDPIYVDVTQSSADMLKLRAKIDAGQVMGGDAQQAPVKLLLDDVGSTYEREGALKFSDITVDEATGNVQIRALFPNPDGKLLPGLFVRALLKQGQLDNVLLAPQQSITRTASGQAMAWIVDEENKAKQTPVETGEAIKDKWVITKGLQAGQHVIVEGTMKVQPGANVTPVDIEAEKANAAAKNPEAQAEKAEEKIEEMNELDPNAAQPGDASQQQVIDELPGPPQEDAPAEAEPAPTKPEDSQKGAQ